MLDGSTHLGREGTQPGWGWARDWGVPTPRSRTRSAWHPELLGGLGGGTQLSRLLPVLDLGLVG